MTTTTRCWSTRTSEIATRPPEPRPSDSGPSISVCDRSFFTVTVQVLLRVTVSSTEPWTGFQSRRSVAGALESVGSGSVLVSVDVGAEVGAEDGDGLVGGSGAVEESSVDVQAVSTRT